MTRPLKVSYDVVICGGGAAGCVVAGRLASLGDVSVLLLEAGGPGDVPEVTDPRIWMRNIGSERDWRFVTEPCSGLNGRRAPLPMGRVLGGGSAINGLVWARGHKADFDLWEAETGDAGWGFDAAISLYRRIEAWDGPPSDLRGSSGPMTITLPKDPAPVVGALLEATPAFGIPRVDDHNAEAVSGDGCCAVANVNVAPDGTRVSTARAYLGAQVGRANLTVLTGATVRRIRIERNRATGVEFELDGEIRIVEAGRQVVLSLGGIHTPKTLMLSGVGDERELTRHGIEVTQHLPGVGGNFQDHILVGGCVFEYRTPEPPRNNSAEFTFFCKSDSSLPSPDLQPMLEETAFGSEVTGPAFNLPADPSLAFTLAPGLIRPKSRGRVRLTGPRPEDPVSVEANFLSEQADVTALKVALELCRDIGNSEALRPFVKRELMPGPLSGADHLEFLRNAAGTYFHQSCTASMGRDAQAVVDGKLNVYGIENLRVADASVMPAITSGNTLAPCVLIGERAADLIAADLGLSPRWRDA